MIRCAIVVCSFLSLAQGRFPTIGRMNSTSLPTPELDPNVMGVCFFGRIPSARCVFACFSKSRAPYCDQALCMCRDEAQIFPDGHNNTESTTTTTESPLEQLADHAENKTEAVLHRITFYIFDLSKIFGLPEEDNTTVPLDGPSHIIPKSRSFQELWTVPHILAMAILTLLVVLVVLEVLHYCRRRRGQKQFFQSVISPPVLEKVYMSEKQ